MFKITTTYVTAETLVLRLEGRLLTDWIPALMSACRCSAEGSCGVELDLAGLSFADADGIEALRILAGQGIQITKSSPFMAELMRENQT